MVTTQNNSSFSGSQYQGDFPWAEFLADHALSSTYRETAERWFAPLIDQVRTLREREDRTLFVGINGCQGSGKSTLAAFICRALAEQGGLRAVSMSLDDFYLTQLDRQALAKKVHPMLATRGVPGTHDVDLMRSTFAALTSKSGEVYVPRFDKAADDRTKIEQWHRIGAPVDVVIWEGWCLGLDPEPEDRLETAVNALEAEEDPTGVWRKYANTALQTYQPLFQQVDYWIMLAAPNFDCVWRWRCEQEAKLEAALGDTRASKVMSPGEIARFVQFYQRLTEWSLDSIPQRMHLLYQLDEQRQIKQLKQLRQMP